MRNFTQLHLHTMFSLLDGISSTEDYVKKAKENGHEAIAITDHGRMNGIFYHQDICKKNGIKPIIGIEMYLNDDLIFKKDDKRKRTHDKHIILLSKTEKGYKNLLKLNYLSMKDEEHFYYSPRITTKELFENSQDVICGTACLGSPFSELLRQEKAKKAEDLFVSYLDIFKDNFYAEIQLNELTGEIDNLPQGQKTYNDWIIQTANKYGVPIVITGDVHYVDKGMDKLQTLSIAIRDGATIDNLNFEIESKNLFYHTVDDYLSFNKDFNYKYEEKDIISWCDNSVYIANKIDFVFKERTKMFLPKITEDDDISLIKESKKGLMDYFEAKEYEECPKNYRERLEYELKVIIRKGFSSYFLILWDIMEYAKKEKISRALARGSGGGSLVAFCLNITKLDPIRFDLLFERFLSQSRSSDVVYDYFVKD